MFGEIFGYFGVFHRVARMPNQGLPLRPAGGSERYRCNPPRRHPNPPLRMPLRDKAALPHLRSFRPPVQEIRAGSFQSCRCCRSSFDGPGKFNACFALVTPPIAGKFATPLFPRGFHGAGSRAAGCQSARANRSRARHLRSARRFPRPELAAISPAQFQDDVDQPLVATDRVRAQRARSQHHLSHRRLASYGPQRESSSLPSVVYLPSRRAQGYNLPDSPHNRPELVHHRARGEP